MAAKFVRYLLGILRILLPNPIHDQAVFVFAGLQSENFSQLASAVLSLDTVIRHPGVEIARDLDAFAIVRLEAEYDLAQVLGLCRPVAGRSI